MSKGTPLTANERDIISALYFDGKKGPKSIAGLLGVTDSPICTQTRIEELIRENKVNEAIAYAKTKRADAALEWALKKYNKTLPKPEPVPEKDIMKEMGLDSIKEMMAEAITENCKGDIRQIDKEQIGRIMYALGKIDGRLENIESKLGTVLMYIEETQKQNNANADNLFNLVKDFKGAMAQAMSKRRY